MGGLPCGWLIHSKDGKPMNEPTHPVLRETHRRNPGWRVPRTGLVLEALAPAVFEQKVTSHEAWRGWRQLVRRYGEAAPGPDAVQALRMHVPPTPQVWSRVPSWEWHRAGVDQTRSRTVVRAASVAGRLEQITGLAHDEAAARLRSLPGVGVWTAAEVAQRALGDPDAVSVGDFHLAGLVGWALVGEKVDDDGMLELLEPYRGHRYRAVRMIELSGIAPPRRGQRFAGRDDADAGQQPFGRLVFEHEAAGARAVERRLAAAPGAGPVRRDRRR